MKYLRSWSRSAVALSLVGIGVAMAGHAAAAASAPEIDASSGVNAIALFSGALLMIRGRKRK